MANGGSLGRMERGSRDPSEALTVPEAARLVGVSEAALRRKIQSGSLLHEVGRRAGREVQLVRFFDLVDEYPDVLVPAEAPEEVPVEAPPGTSEEATVRSRPGTRADPEPVVPEPVAEGAPAEGIGGSGVEPGAMRRQNHAFEVRLASLQAANQAFSEQVRELQVQRGDLREQCTDLRVRLTAVEKERQASTAGLLMAQRRLLEIEAHPTALLVKPPRWRRVATWAAVLLALLGLAFVVQRQIRGGRDLEALHGLIAPALERADQDRARLAQEVELRRQAFESSLVEVREEGQASRSELLAHLQELVGHSETLTATLESERALSEAARARLEAELSATRREAEGARRALEEERELRAEAVREGARQRAELDARIAEIAEQVRASGATAARVGEQLVERDDVWNESLARLKSELEQLRAERRDRDERDRALTAARSEAARAWLSWYWISWMGGLAVVEARADGPAAVDDA